MILNTKGVAMLVSAISENFYQAPKNINNTAPVRKSENVGETVFNSLIAPSKRSASIEKLCLFESINEWKNFCHQKIVGGNLDVIA